MRSRTVNQSGIIIRRHGLPAGDFIVTILTPQGKLKAIARGGARSSLSNRLNLFHDVTVQLYRSEKNMLPIIKQAILEGALPTLAQPERHVFAHFIAELSDLLFPESEEMDQGIFESFAAALRGIAHHDDPEWVTLVMAYKLLDLAGMIPQTDSCDRCDASFPAHPNQQSGNLLCQQCARLPAYSPQTLAFLRTVMKKTVRANMDVTAAYSVRQEIWKALERFTTAHIGRILCWSAIKKQQRQDMNTSQ